METITKRPPKTSHGGSDTSDSRGETVVKVDLRTEDVHTLTQSRKEKYPGIREGEGQNPFGWGP